MAGSKRKIIRVLLFDPDATDSDSDSDSEFQNPNSQIKNKKTVIQTIEIRKPAPARKPKTLIHQNPKPQIQTTNSLPKPPIKKNLIQATNLPNSTHPQSQNPTKTLNVDSTLILTKKQPSSQYKGVRRRQSGNWAAEIRDPIRGTRIWLGTFKSEQLAHQVYQAALMHFEREKAQMKENMKENPTGPVQSVEDLDMKEGDIRTGDLQCIQSLQGLPSALMKRSKEMKESRTNGPVQCFDDLPSFMKKRDETGDVHCIQSDQGLQSPLTKKRSETLQLQMKEAEISTGHVQCFQSVKPKSAPYTKKKRTETVFGPPVHSLPKNKLSTKDSTRKPRFEIPVKSNSSITSLSSREKSNSCILDSGVSQKEKGETDFHFTGLEIPDFDFRFDEAELLGDFGGEEDLIRLDDVPLWTENFESCDLSFLDL